MSGTVFTPEQEKAINTRNCDLLVSAAAGSGKTAVLVERIIRLITNKEKPVDIDRLLVVTFTDAAASEMRQRILKALDDMIKQQPQNEHLKRQEMLMRRASITTIHSFCLSIIRKYFYLINIDPNFRIIDKTESDLLRAETMRSFFEELYEKGNTELFVKTFKTENNANFLKLVECYGDKVKDDKLQELALKLFDFIQSCPWPERWLKEYSDKLSVSSIEDMEQSDWYNYFVSETRMTLQGALAAIHVAVELCGHYEINPLAVEALFDDRDKINNAINALDKGFEYFYESMQFSFVTLKLSLAKKKGAEESEEVTMLKKQISDIRKDEIKTPITNIQKKVLFMDPQGILKNIRESQVNIKTLCDVVIGFSKRFYDLKRARNIADFSDFEHLCIKALVLPESAGNNIIPSAAALELREKYDEVLMDEYQDSNLVQELILSSVARSGERERNRFMVGDIKQSIYKFRMANPDLFRQKYTTYDTNSVGDKQRIDLSKNFRSRKSILHGINFIFKQIMSEDLGEVGYDASASLYYGANYPEPMDNSVNQIEFIIMDMSEKKPDEEPDSVQAETEYSETNLEYETSQNDAGDIIIELTNAELEARMVAARIKELLGNDGRQTPFQVAEKNGRFRDIELRDIVILLRSTRNIAEAYARELKNADLQAFSDSAAGYFEAVEIMTILSLLKVIDNPRQDIHLISVLYSTIYMFTPDELVDIRKSLEKGLFIDCIEEYIENSGSNNITRDKLLRFNSDLKRWREMAVYYSISDLLQQLYEETEYFDYAATMPGGKVRQANLTALFERAVKYEKTKQKGLFHFIKYIEKMQNNKAEFGNAKVLSENDNLIRIMSIHKSKGLEFPVVFVCGLGRGFNLRDAASDLLLHQKLGFGPMHIDAGLRVKYNTLARYAVSRKIIMESLSEEMRILYVALTRAKEKLILTATCKNVEKKIMNTNQYLSEGVGINPYRLSQKRTFADWIIFSVLRHRDVIEALDLRDSCKYVPELFYDTSEWKIEIVKKTEFIKKDQQQHTVRAGLLNELNQIDTSKDYSGMKNKIAHSLSYEYPSYKASEIPSKISISEIKRINYELQIKDSETFEEHFAEQYMIDLKAPDFMSNDNSNKGNAIRKGTLIHAVMERLDMKKHDSYNSIEAIVSEMIDKKIINKEDAALIDIMKVLKFLQTDLAKRIQKSQYVKKEIPFVLGMSPVDIDKRWAEAAGETVLVHGIIDCIFEEDGDIILLDYKSDRVNKSNLEQVIGRYKIQLDIYKRAIEANIGKKVRESLIYFFELNDFFKI